MKKITIADYGWWSVFTTKRSRMHQYIFENYQCKYKKKPEYVLCSVFGGEYEKYDGVRILQSAENICPDFNIFDYAIGFEYLDFGDRYFRAPNWIMNLKYELLIQEMCEKQMKADTFIAMKDGFCSFVYSNANAHPMREKIYKSVSKYKRVDSGGRYLNNVGGAVDSKENFDCKHKFSIACENSSHRGYTTEKLVEAFAHGTIPIYWGDPWVEKIFNKNSFINVMNYDSLDEVVEVIERIDQDDGIYYKMLSEPALNDVNYVNNIVRDLELFIDSIFKQNYEEAFRRNRR